MRVIPYNREKAVEYAHRWAYDFNPRYYNFSSLGGDCTNFASQCVYAGVGIMNYTPVYGWFYRSTNDRTASWTGVEYFYNFMVGNDNGVGPFMEHVPLREILPGDVIQLKFEKDVFQHTPVVVEVGSTPAPDNILVAAHTFEADYRALSTYMYTELRPLHVLGVRTY